MTGRGAKRAQETEQPAGSAQQAVPAPQERISLFNQIELLARLAEEQEEEEQRPAKKTVPPVHSLTQNTTHRTIRWRAAHWT